MATDQTGLMTTKEAAHVLGLSPGYLYYLRKKRPGVGPKWRQFGKKVRYMRSDLMEYIERAMRN